MYRIVLVALLACATPAFAQAPSVQVPAVQVQDAWARATASPASSGLIYLTLTATGGPDTLVAAATPVAGVAQLHQTTNDNGIMKMDAVPTLALPPGKPVVLGPGGYHIMLTHMTRQLKPGEHFPVTLTFARAGKVTTTVTVTTAGASTAPTAGGMSDMNMGNMPMPK